MEIMIEITSKLGESFAFGYDLDETGDMDNYPESDVYYDMSEAFYENYYLFDEKIEQLREELNKECTEASDSKQHYDLAKKIVENNTEPINAEINLTEGLGDFVFPYDLKEMFIAMIANEIA
jgi:hypothetical protein